MCRLPADRGATAVDGGGSPVAPRPPRAYCKDRTFSGIQGASEKFLQDYQQAFVRVFGQPAANQTWGFGQPANARMTRSGNTTAEGYVRYGATHEYKDENGKVIAGANMNRNMWAGDDASFGGWLVPDALTEGQKERVKAYFQANPNLDHEDPHYAHFFVQQVYKGGPSTAGSNSTEEVVAADGSKYTSTNMNHLTVGIYNSHINDFNGGTTDVKSVPKNDKTEDDQITLMVNVDDTSCFGYHDTGSSNQSADSPNHNDKWALVSAAKIDEWAEAQTPVIGEKVTDKWDRSFLGFDLAIKEGDQVYVRNNDGTV